MRKSIFRSTAALGPAALMITTLAWGLLASTTAHAVRISLPCDDSGKNGLRKCAAVLYGEGQTGGAAQAGGNSATRAANPTDQPISDPGIVKLLKDRVRMQMQAIYGYYPDQNRAGAAPIWHPQGVSLELNPETYPGPLFGPLGRQTCNIVGIGANTFPEFSTADEEHVAMSPSDPAGAHSCGEPVSLRVELNLKAERHDDDRCPFGTLTWRCLEGVDPQAFTDMRPPKGTREAAYLQGSYLSALNCWYSTKMQQIEQQKYLEIEDAGPVQSDCKALTEQTLNMAAGADGLYKKLIAELDQKGLSGNSEYSDIVNCKSTWKYQATTADKPDLGSLRQKAQQLCAARTAIESAFERLAECQIFWLAKTAWLNVAVDANDAYWELIQSETGDRCARHVQDYMKTKFKVPSDIDKFNFSRKAAIGECARCGASCAKNFAICAATAGIAAAFGVDCKCKKKCDISEDNCPIRKDLSPYQRDAEFLAEPSPTFTQSNEEATRLANDCYNNGVPAKGIKSYKQAIREYLAKQWPKDASSCSLTGPR